jgi:hypothetical protein
MPFFFSTALPDEEEDVTQPSLSADVPASHLTAATLRHRQGKHGTSEQAHPAGKLIDLQKQTHFFLSDTVPEQPHVTQLSPTQEDARGQAEVENLPSRVLMDVFHLMYRIKCHAGHALRSEFFQAFRDILLRPDPSDKANVEAFFKKEKEENRRKKNGAPTRTWDKSLQAQPQWLWRRVRRAIPDKEELLGAVHELFNKYRDLKDDSRAGKGKPLFTETDRKVEAGILEAIERGFVSDPTSFSLYYEIGIDKNGLQRYRCIRGTSDLEGAIHGVIRAGFTAFNCSILYFDTWLARWRTQYNTNVSSLFLGFIQTFDGSQAGFCFDVANTNCRVLSQVGHRNRYGKKYLHHYDLSLKNEVDNLFWELFQQPAYSRYINGTHYEQTKEEFGLTKVPSTLLPMFGMELCRFKLLFCCDIPSAKSSQAQWLKFELYATMNVAEYWHGVQPLVDEKNSTLKGRPSHTMFVTNSLY